MPTRVSAFAARPPSFGERTLMNRFLLPVLAVLSLGINVLVAQVAGPGTVAGTVTYRQRIALPPDAVLDVRLQDTSRPDTAARTIAQATIPTAGAQVPIPFRIDYDPAAIDPSHSYSVRATITVSGKLLYTSTTMYPVLTRGAGSDVAMKVYMILPADAPNVSPAGAPDNRTGKDLP